MQKTPDISQNWDFFQISICEDVENYNNNEIMKTKIQNLF